MTTPLSGELAAFTEQLSFTLDDFQQRACRALEDGHGVLVCAPTGAGKTVVGEFAVHLALAAGRKCFYTTPIKALSNQKHADLVRRYGPDRIGLLTGDQSINGDAPIVVMTTEVLRNMLYANSDTLARPFACRDGRGALPRRPDARRGVGGGDPAPVRRRSPGQPFGDGEQRRGVRRLDPDRAWRHHRGRRRAPARCRCGSTSWSASGCSTSSTTGPAAPRRTAASCWWTHNCCGTSRIDAKPTGLPTGVRATAAAATAAGRASSEVRRGPTSSSCSRTKQLLPAITFIFSRVGCDAAVKQCLRSSLRLTTDEERARIAEVVDRRCADLSESDLVVLGYHEWRDGLLRGLAAHHAGMLPAFRHTVEELFTEGLVKAVFATETLALGINMPARTVVLERLVKFDGEQHVQLTPGEYTQLTGRAGRRGIDVEGHAVVLWTPDVDPAEVAGLASTRTFPLRSSFAPSYNMTINLVNQMGPTQAHKLLESVLRAVPGGPLGGRPGARHRTRRADARRDRRRTRRPRRARSSRVRAVARGDLPAGEGAVAGVAAAAQAGRQRCAVVVAARRHRQHRQRAARGAGGGPRARPRRGRPAAAGADRKPLGGTDFVGRLFGRIGEGGVDDAAQAGRAPPAAGAPRSGVGAAVGHRRHVDTQGQAKWAAARPRRRSRTRGLREAAVAPPRPPSAGSRGEGPARPSDTCASNATTSRSSRRWPLRPTRWRERSTGSSCCSPSAASSATSTATRGSPTTAGCWPASTAKATCWSPNACVAACGRACRPRSWRACFRRCSTSHGAIPPTPQAAEIPTGKLRRALADTRRFAAELRTDEQRHRISQSREPDEGFVAAVYRWATTGDLAAALDASDIGRTGSPLSAGDFVRWCRQVLDLADQVRNAAADTGTARRRETRDRRRSTRRRGC